MSNWAISGAPRVDDVLGISGDDSVLLTAGATGTKGSWTNIGTTTYAWEGFWLNFADNGSGQNNIVDISINVAGTDYIIVDNYQMDDGYNSASTVPSDLVWIPVRVPAGAVINARTQSDVGNNVSRLQLRGISRSAGANVGYSRLEMITTLSSSLPSSTLTAASGSPAYTQLVASTAKRYAGLIVILHNNNANVNLAGYLDIGIGASDKLLIGSILWRQAGYNIKYSPPAFMVDIPAGSRLSGRLRSASSTATRRVGLYGLVL